MKTAKILFNLETNNLNKLYSNQNLLTSTFFKFLNLANSDQLKEKLGYDKVVGKKTNEKYDLVIARFGDKDIKKEKNVPIYEFYFDSINGGWFFERYTSPEGEVIIPDETRDGCFVNQDRTEINKILSEYFFRVFTSTNNEL